MGRWDKPTHTWTEENRYLWEMGRANRRNRTVRNLKDLIEANPIVGGWAAGWAKPRLFMGNNGAEAEVEAQKELSGRLVFCTGMELRGRKHCFKFKG